MKVQVPSFLSLALPVSLFFFHGQLRKGGVLSPEWKPGSCRAAKWVTVFDHGALKTDLPLFPMNELAALGVVVGGESGV